MKRKQLGLLIAAVLLVAPIVTGNNAKAAQAKETSGVTCDFNSNNKQASTNTLGGTIKIKNTTGKELDLSKITIDYYYSADKDIAQNFWCDYCGVTKGDYQNFTSTVKASFEKTGDSDPTKSDVIKITFGSGVLKAGDEVDLQFRVARNDWSNYDQSNDYAYENGVVFDGEEDKPPVVIVTPDVTPAKTVYDQNAPEDITTTIDYKGHEEDAALESISNDGSELKAGKDYVVSDEEVILKDSYLATLAVGENTLTYKFANDTTATVKVNVIEKESTDPSITPSTAVFDKDEPEDVTVNVIYKGHELTALKNGETVLVEGQDYTVSEDKIVISEDYLSTLADGKADITFVFDGEIEKDLTVTVKSENLDDKLNITASTVKAKAGDVVEIPVLINIPDDVDTYGVGFNYNIDSDKVEFISVTKGAELEAAADDIVVESNYIPSQNLVVNYSLFPNAKDQTASVIHGKYVFATFKLKLNSDLKSGDKLPINITDMAYATKDGKAMTLTSKIGNIVIK